MKKTLIRVLKSAGFSVVMVSYGVLVEASVLHVPSEYPTIQSAITAAVTGDTVLVDDGTYIENINFLGKAITVVSVNGTTRTIIDGNKSGSVVTFNSGEGNMSVLSGFTIQNGGADDGGGIYCGYSSSPTITNCTISRNSAGYGGGIYCYSSSLTITNCTISGNSAVYGGGIYCYGYSSPTIINCTLSRNSASYGGGIYCYSSSPTITNCTIRGNSANYRGGGIYCDDYSSPTITNCIISENSTNYDGGGICCMSYSSPTITNCTISGNSANYPGGGICCTSYSSPTITNCTISGNSANYPGGGIYCDAYSSPTITNCTISRNSAKYGGGIYCYYSSLTITNCTISGNSANVYGGGISCSYSSPTVVNNILWGDTPDEIYLSNSSINITYSDIAGGWAGEGNIDADPLFVGGGDYHLTADSPCIDTGTSTGAPPDDIDGDIRPQGAGYDMGSDEYVEEIQPPVPDIKANGSDGTITTSGPVSITIELNSGNYAGQNADWWHVAETPFGWYRYQVSGNTWVPGLTVSYQGPLFNLTPPFNTLNTPLPSGTYTIYFGVDINMNGVIDFDSLYYDSVVVIVP